MLAGLTLLISDRPDVERDAVAAAWEAAGGNVMRVARFWELPPIERGIARVYGADTFCQVVAEKLGLDLVSPDDRLLATAPELLLHRRLAVVRLGSLRPEDFPAFVKAVLPKQFRSAVYSSLESLAAETHGLDESTDVVVSEVVTFVAEARAFVRDGVVQTCSIYEGVADVGPALEFEERVAMSIPLPRTCVVDIGLLHDGRWALIEFNATWGAGLNGCDPARAVECIAAASQ
jgi:hypothetical protein